MRLPVRLPVLPRREPCLCRGGRRGGRCRCGASLTLRHTTAVACHCQSVECALSLTLRAALLASSPVLVVFSEMSEFGVRNSLHMLMQLYFVYAAATRRDDPSPH